MCDIPTMEDCCWICMDEQDGNVPKQVCGCPRKVHPQCLARWQLQQAGKQEETKCRFCDSQLLDWKDAFIPDDVKPYYASTTVTMRVIFEGRTYYIKTTSGEAGKQEFINAIRQLCNIDDDVDFDLNFNVREPVVDNEIQLFGQGAYDAAIKCGRIAAAMHRKRETALESQMPCQLLKNLLRLVRRLMRLSRVYLN